MGSKGVASYTSAREALAVLAEEHGWTVPGRARDMGAALAVASDGLPVGVDVAETGDWALETGNGMTITTTIGDPQ